MSDVTTYYVWDARMDRMVQLPSSVLLRRAHTVYQLRNTQWDKVVQAGHHAAFDYDVAFKVWKKHTGAIFVVEWPAPEGTHQLPSFVWCLCISRCGAEIESPQPPYANVLWPIHPSVAKSLYLHFQGDDTMANSSLLNFLPHDSVGGNTSTGEYPFSWSKHPSAKLSEGCQYWQTRLFMASIRPSAFSSDGAVSENEQRELTKSEYLKLPDEMLGHVNTGSRSRKARKLGKSLSPFERLSDDVVEDFLCTLAWLYIRTPAYGAHRHWTALRGVCKAFRDAADRAAVDFVEGADSRLRSVEDDDGWCQVERLRLWVLPTGLNLYHIAEAKSRGTLSGYEPRVALLSYMRLRSNRAPSEEPPEAPPPPAPAVTDLVVMTYSHGEPGWWRQRQEQLRYEQRTRSKAPLLQAVSFKLRVEPWQVKMMEGRGWHVEED